MLIWGSWRLVWHLVQGMPRLAINVTVFGSDVSLSPMLTGGEPLRIAVDGTEIWITEDEIMAADALMSALTPEQRALAIRSNTAINLVLGPGEDGVILAPERLPSSEMTEDEKVLLVALIDERIGFLNDDDAAAKRGARCATGL